MVRSGSVFCPGQKTLTNKQQSLGVDFLLGSCCICYVRGALHFIKLRGERRQQDIFAHRQSSIWGGGGMKINLSRRTIYLTLSSSDSGVHLSRAAAEKSAAALHLKHHRSIFIQILPFCSHHDCFGDCLGDGDDESGDDLKFLEKILAALCVFI